MVEREGEEREVLLPTTVGTGQFGGVKGGANDAPPPPQVLHFFGEEGGGGKGGGRV